MFRDRLRSSPCDAFLYVSGGEINHVAIHVSRAQSKSRVSYFDCKTVFSVHTMF